MTGSKLINQKHCQIPVWELCSLTVAYTWHKVERPSDFLLYTNTEQKVIVAIEQFSNILHGLYNSELLFTNQFLYFHGLN